MTTERRRVCIAPDCDTVSRKRLCPKHAYRVKRYGTFTLPSPPTLEERFWSKVAKRGPEECWEWTASTVNGYGQFFLEHIPATPERKATVRSEHAHRVSWRLANGPIPDGLLVRHKCDNPPCVNPAHLELGTQADNIQDKVSRGRQLRGEGIRQAKLTPRKVMLLRRVHQAGVPDAVIAELLGMTNTAIALAIRGETWRHLPTPADRTYPEQP